MLKYFIFYYTGDTGSGVLEWVRFLLGKDMEFPHIKVIFPTAPLQPYTPADGDLSHVWFDRKAITIEAPEARISLSKMYEKVAQLIKQELESGIPPERIIVGGFSMGGALAMHIGYHCNPNVAGVFACSSFLNRGSIVYDSLKNRSAEQSLPNLLMFHGLRDDLVPAKWGQESFDKLQEHGVKGEFVPLKNTLHELKKVEIQQIQNWIMEKLPPLESDLSNKL